MNRDVDSLLEALDTLWNNFNNCRALFPYMGEDAVGATSGSTGDYYKAQGLDISFVFNRGITLAEIKKINQIGHWINQNFVIRLCALLESYNILSETIKIEFSLHGAEHINIVRRLRDCFAHSSGRFNPTNDKHLKTMKLMKEHLPILGTEYTDWPLPIDTVLKPLYDGCVNYAKQKMNRV